MPCIYFCNERKQRLQVYILELAGKEWFGVCFSFLGGVGEFFKGNSNNKKVFFVFLLRTIFVLHQSEKCQAKWILSLILLP